MRTVTFVRGLPGSGKSTVARALIAGGGVHIENDQWFMKDGDYNYDPDQRGLACQHAFKRFLYELMNGNDDIVVANTFIERWELAPFIMAAQVYNHDGKNQIREAASFWCRDVDACFKNNVHGVPKDVIQSMKDRWEPTGDDWI